MSLFTVAPRRVVDARGGAPIGGSALQGQQTRVFAVDGIGGIPSTARALWINLTITQPDAAGYVVLFKARKPSPNCF